VVKGKKDFCEICAVNETSIETAVELWYSINRRRVKIWDK
jgi:hypothetical protein